MEGNLLTFYSRCTVLLIWLLGFVRLGLRGRVLGRRRGSLARASARSWSGFLRVAGVEKGSEASRGSGGADGEIGLHGGRGRGERAEGDAGGG